jgi:hypothetical protein
MSYTLDENGRALTETRDGVTMPVDCSFEKVNDWIHGIDVQFEEVQALCLGMASENDRLRKALQDIAEWTDRWTSGDHPVGNVARKALDNT